MSHDVIVVGGSFAGLSAAMQLARARRDVLVVDAGLPRNRFADASHGFLGQDGKAPFEILREARQLSAYPTVSFVEGEARDASQEGEGFAVALGDGRSLRSKRLVLATGVADQLPDIPGLKPRWGATVLHCPYCHGYEARDRRLGVLASGPMDLHKAQMIPDWGPTTLFSQGLPIDAATRKQLITRGVTIEEVPVIELLGDEPDLSGARLADGRIVAIEAIFASPTVRMASPLAERLGCAQEDGPLGPLISADDWKATSVAGVFAAGDAARANHNATLASADGVLAGVGAHRSLVFG
ncbi:thioredoxin reductase [Caulobacter zeae]|uniref:Thioredoxin reductase n=1 Tax=Caulobacter zeae TaxID=2055137 RepID=A0A2N5DEC0_9CAUL|nr:NAD(P)/FAD-dependent oxidoreductase [Caulobacter zeae]PLR24419.1 thioredoxin reductase [Caulobacter zeae]